MKLRLQPHHAPRFATVQSHSDARVTTLPVPGFRQTRDYTCGFTTALMVLRYFRVAIPAVELFRSLGTSPDGTRQNSLVRVFRASGLRANVRRDVDFARLRREIERNKLIVGYVHDDEHWVVVYGYGVEPERVFVADPEPDQPCEHVWHEYGPRLANFGIVCSLHRGDASARQRPLSLVEPVLPPAPIGPPPLPVPQLRCEVRVPELEPEPIAPPVLAQLPLPFAPDDRADRG